MQPPPTPLNTPAANGEVEPSTSAANRHVRPNQPHFYPVTKEPTTPSQVYTYKKNFSCLFTILILILLFF